MRRVLGLRIETVDFSSFQHGGRTLVRDPGQYVTRGGACQTSEVVDHVHLIVKLQVMGDIEPCPIRPRYFGFECGLKACNPGTSFGRQTRNRAKFPLKLAHTQSTLGCGFRDRKDTLLRKQAVGGVQHAVICVDRGSAPAEVSFDEVYTLRKRGQFGEPCPKGPYPPAKHRSRVKALVRQ